MADLRYGCGDCGTLLRNAARPPGRQQRARLAHQKAGDPRYELWPVTPRPMARTLRDFDLRGTAERRRVDLRELRRDVLVVGAPHHQRRAAQPVEMLPRT